MSYCERCLFASKYHDMSASIDVCKLVWDLTKSAEIREINKGKSTCPYAIFLCDLVDALDLSVGVPDRNVFTSYAYKCSYECKTDGCNCDKHVVLVSVENL